MITPDTVIVGAGPRITLAQFAGVLTDARSPAASDAGLAYRAIVAEKVDPAAILAIFFKESRYATDPASMVVRHDTKNPGNCRSSRIGPQEVISTERGDFVKYDSWAAGFRDAARRLVDPPFDYARAGAVTIDRIIQIWAPFSDGNDPVGYAATVVKLMNSWITVVGEKEGKTMKDPVTRIRLIPGHAGRGRGGGNPLVMTMHVQEGMNDLYPEFLNRPPETAADCTIWSKQDGTLDRLLLDTDTPWTNGDIIAPDLSNPIIAGLVKKGITNSNRYALTIEHQGFAAAGFTDAQLEGTAQMIAYWCSLYGWTPSRTNVIGHYQIGNHKNCPGPLFPFDRVIARAKEILLSPAPAVTAAAVGGTAPMSPTFDPIMDYFNANGGETAFGKPMGGQYGTSGSVERDFERAHMVLDQATGKVAAEPVLRLNGHIVAHGMLDYWNRVNVPGIQHPLGLPLSEEQDWTDPSGKHFVIQIFERAVLGYDGSIADPAYRVQGLITGPEWARAHLKPAAA